MLEAIGEDPEGQGLNLRQRVASVLAVGQHPRELRHLGHPTTVVFALQLDLEVHDARQSRRLRGCRLTDRASAAGATVLGAPFGCLLHRGLLGAQMERCRGARQLQALVRQLGTG